MAQRLDERPLVVDVLVQQRRVELCERASTVAGPQVLDHRPCLAEAGRVGRAQLGPFGVATIQLRLDERADVDAVDAETSLRR